MSLEKGKCSGKSGNRKEEPRADEAELRDEDRAEPDDGEGSSDRDEPEDEHVFDGCHADLVVDELHFTPLGMAESIVVVPVPT